MQINEKTKQSLVIALRLGFFALLIGRAWQAFRFDLPLRAILWNEDLLQPLIPGDWASFASSKSMESLIENAQFSLAVFWAGCAVIVVSGLCESKNTKKVKVFDVMLWCANASILALGFLYYLNRGFQFATFIEYASQYGIGVLYLLTARNAVRPGHIVFALLCICMTFLGHGIYALGLYYPQPGNYLDMTMSLLGVSESSASTILVVIGVLDVIAAFLIWVPQCALYSLRYILVWGGATAMARVLAHLDWIPSGVFAETWIHELLIRIPHVALPLFVYFYLARILRSLSSNFVGRRYIWSFNLLSPKSF